MEQTASAFETFSPGSHLIIGDAGSGKTRLMWAALQSNFLESDAINIVLTDSQKNAWYLPSQKPIITLDPYSTDISWASNPTQSGIYYCACDYIPRIITFMECLSTWSIQSEHKKESVRQPLRLFLDFSSKHWLLPEFIEQVSRLHYISSTRAEDHNHPIELWTSQGLSAKVPKKIRTFFSDFHIIVLNPAPAGWAQDITTWLGTPSSAPSAAAACLQNADFQKPSGFYYATQDGSLSLYSNQIQIQDTAAKA
ncbi:MAG: hypothetical protein FWG14_03095 [Peptococcaceae bacterium]|nr:hypothetical protein [Peptococcaceae bacterium]